jgi:hypothetical protein
MTCSVCDLAIPVDDGVECADWPGRWHHTDCARHCLECRGAHLSERKGW